MPAAVETTPPVSIPAVPIVPAPAATDPVDALFGDDPVKPAEAPKPADTPVVDPASETPAPAMPEGEATPKTDAIDDLFGDTTKPAEPAKDAEAAKETAKESAIDDLFGTETNPPAKEAPAEKPKESIDDLFGTEKSDPSAKPAPADEPKIDDLFGTESTEPTPAKTAPAPASNESIDDLFGTPDPKPSEGEPAPAQGATDSAKPAETLDDIFGKPVSTEASQKPNADDKYLDSLFPTKPEPTKTDSSKGAPGQSKPQPSKDSSPKKGNADPLDELFGLGEFTPPQQFRGAEFQTWVDNTGTYSVKARLAVIYTDRVKLLKENGKFTTVPLSRLSDRDFAYVQWVASNLSSEANTKFVKNEVENSDSDSIR